MILNYFLAYGVYLLGAVLFFLDVVSNYKKAADANPNPNVQFNGKVFWSKEWINIVRVLLLGVATMIFLIPFGSMSVDFKNSSGDVMFNTSVKVILLPLYLVFGWSGGKATIAIAGRYKKEIYNNVGIKDEDNGQQP